MQVRCIHAMLGNCNCGSDGCEHWAEHECLGDVCIVPGECPALKGRETMCMVQTTESNIPVMEADMRVCGQCPELGVDGSTRICNGSSTPVPITDLNAKCMFAKRK